jgi:hypothetical protein
MHHNAAGIYYEQDTPTTVSDWRVNEALVDELRASIERFSFRDCNLRTGKKADWPSYKVSGCRSIDDFERRYLEIYVRPVNESELFYDASAQPKGEKDIVLHVTIDRYGAKEEIERQILRLFDACSVWDSNLLK